MSIINSAYLTSANAGFRAVFSQQLERSLAEVNQLIDLMCMRVTSDGPTETYDWFGGVPAMTEWKDERTIARMRAFYKTVTNKDWANGIEVSRNDFEDDKLGLVNPRIRSLADEAARHQRSLLVDLINGGATGACYDGQYFFSDSHSEGDSGTQDNAETHALSETYYAQAKAAMMEYKNDRGALLGITPSHLIVGSALEGTARAILEKEYVTAGVTNVWKGTAQVIVLPGMTAKYWVLADLTKPIKPFIFQERRGVTFTPMDTPSDEQVFMRNTYRYGADWRGNMDYAFWQLMYFSTGAA